MRTPFIGATWLSIFLFREGIPGYARLFARIFALRSINHTPAAMVKKQTFHIEGKVN
jgi:hypothetical protein